MTRPKISGISPFFIVHDTTAALSFYRDQLGFEITFQEPADDPFFGIVRRDGAMIMLKDVGVDPLPNYKRDWWNSKIPVMRFVSRLELKASTRFREMGFQTASRR